MLGLGCPFVLQNNKLISNINSSLSFASFALLSFALLFHTNCYSIVLSAPFLTDINQHEFSWIHYKAQTLVESELEI